MFFSIYIMCNPKKIPYLCSRKLVVWEISRSVLWDFNSYPPTYSPDFL